MEAAMDLMRRMLPRHNEIALSALLTLLAHHSMDLLSQVDQPLQVLFDSEAAKEFILCEYNRDSYRFHLGILGHHGRTSTTLLWKMGLSHPLRYLSSRSRQMRSSLYIMTNGSKTAHGRREHLQEGAWEAIHVIEVRSEEDGTAHYCLTSTVMLSLTTEDKESGSFILSGSIRRQTLLRTISSVS